MIVDGSAHVFLCIEFLVIFFDSVKCPVNIKGEVSPGPDSACVASQSEPVESGCRFLSLPSRTPSFWLPQRMSTQPFSGLTFETDYMVRIVPFPTFMNDSYFPPSFLRTNST